MLPLTQPPLMNTFTTHVPVRLKACSERLTVSSPFLFCASFPTLSSAEPLWFLTPLGWAGEEERGQKQERSYLSETAVSLLLWSSLLWYMFQLTLSCGLLLWGVLKSFCFSSKSNLTFNLLLPQMVDGIDSIRGLLHLLSSA